MKGERKSYLFGISGSHHHDKVYKAKGDRYIMAIEEEGLIEEVTTCIKCGKSLEGLKRRKNRKFCSTLCRTRHFALKRYYEIKSTDEYKAKRKVYEKKWREANKDKWNARMRKASRKYRDKKKLEKQQNQIQNKPLNEDGPGQQVEEKPLEGANVEHGLPEGNLPNEICACGHSNNNHSYDPAADNDNLDCDICDCKNFRTPSRVAYENNTAIVEEPAPTYQYPVDSPKLEYKHPEGAA